MFRMAKVFGIVIGLHAGLALLLFVQPGCQSTEGPRASETVVTPTGTGDASEGGLPTGAEGGSLDPEFNAGIGDGRRRDSGEFQEPTRPEGDFVAGGRGFEGADQAGDVPLTPLEPLEPLGPVVSRETYTVQRGDTLWGIAQRHGLSLSDLVSANGIDPSRPLRVGEELLIPASPRGTGARGERDTGSGFNTPRSGPDGGMGSRAYTVQRGDTLSGIASRYDSTVQAIRAANEITGDQIYPGQELRIPEAPGGSVSPTGGAGSLSVTGDDPFEGNYHVVERGETPGGIARRYGMSTDELMGLNGISDPRSMQVGQVLRLTSGRGSADSGRNVPRPSASAPQDTLARPARTERASPSSDSRDNGTGQGGTGDSSSRSASGNTDGPDSDDLFSVEDESDVPLVPIQEEQ